MELARLIAQLATPEVYPAHAEAVEIHQTHISVVFLAGSLAYKIKKPVDLGFVDYSTLEKRRHWCAEEVRLNRRLAPEIYLGVVPVCEHDGVLRVEGPGTVVEWAVKMKRLPESAMLRSALERGDIAGAAIEELGRRVALFHRTASRSAELAAYGRFDVVAQNTRDNFEQSAAHVGTTVSQSVFDRMRALAEEALARLKKCIEDRAARGVPCDTHGDLRLDHVYFFPECKPPGDLVIVDCIEFNPRFRAADPVADMAFLMMDLMLHDRRDLALVFRDAYFQSSGDLEGRILVPFYISYRAAVRAKVEGMKASETEVGAAERARARKRAAAHWLLALGALEDVRRRPCLVLVGGLPGTGKSTLARALAARTGFLVIRSDQVRKDLATLSNAEVTPGRYGSGIYSADWTERTYRECLRRARAALLEGTRAIVDATFRAESHRRSFLELAQECGVPALLLICKADPALVKARLEERREDLSDADWEIYLQAAGRWEPLSAQTRRKFHPIDTSQTGVPPLAQALDWLREHELWD